MRLCSARRAVLLQPGEDLIVPVAAIGRLEDPVPFVWEVDELRGDAEPLQRREELMPFAYGTTEVQVIMDDQHRRLEVLSVTVGRVFLIGFTGVAPRRPLVLPLVEPEFVGGHIHRLEVIDTAVGNQRLEAGGLALEPVHHVATKGGASSELALLVDVR